MKGQTFKWDPDSAPPILQDHSERKLTLIGNYLRRYLEVMGGNRRADRVRLTLVDGFAGGGTFQLDGSEVSGTPLVMLEEVDRARRILNDSGNGSEPSGGISPRATNLATRSQTRPASYALMPTSNVLRSKPPSASPPR